LRSAWLALGLALVPRAEAQPLHIDHAPPACLVAEKASVIVACLVPRSARADVRVLFRADDGPWYATALRSEMPCYRGVLPRPSADTPRVSYVIEAHRGGATARSAEHEVPVAPACPGPSAPIASGRASWKAPAGAPRTPPGFEGSRLRVAGASGRPAPSATPAPAVAATPRPPVAPALPPAEPAGAKGGHGLRNAAIVLGGAAAAGGAALAIRSGSDSVPATTMGSGLPSSGIAGTYVGTESINYSGSCTGTDDVVLNLQQSSTALSGVLSFTVRTCPCCAAGRGANPVSGFVSDTRVELSTPVGFVYSGSFAGNRLSGSLTGPGGSGTWTVEKR
jgi:hypothetical protein